MGFGVSGSPQTSTSMIGADAVVADMTDTGPRVQDLYLDSRAPCNGVSGVCPDAIGGFTNDVSDVSAEQDLDITLIRYRRPLVPTDNGGLTVQSEPVDMTIPSGSGIDTFIVWALGPMSSAGNPLFHDIDFARRNFSIDFGRTVVDNCSPLLTVPITETPSMNPSASPTSHPSSLPSTFPSDLPSVTPSDTPSLQPTDFPATCTALSEECMLSSDCCSNSCRAAIINGPLICRALPKTSKTKVSDSIGRGGAAGRGGRRLLRGSDAVANGKNFMSVSTKNQSEIPEIA